MATLAEVNTALDTLRSAGQALETAAKTLYAELSAVKAVAPPVATAADLDALVASIAADTAFVNTALAAVTAVPATPAA